MTTKVLKSPSVQRVTNVLHFGLLKLFTFLHVYLLNKRMPESNKYIHVYTNQE